MNDDAIGPETQADCLRPASHLEPAEDNSDAITTAVTSEAEPSTPAEAETTFRLTTDAERRTTLEAATPDHCDLVAQTKDHYVSQFKMCVVKNARATLELCRIVYEARQTLSMYEFARFCEEVGARADSSTIRKYHAIGKLYPRFIQYVDQLPDSWTSIYLLTQIPARVFENVTNRGESLATVTGSKLQRLVKETRDLNNIEGRMPKSKQVNGHVFGKVVITKREIDDIDWRAIKKALAEVESRLPLKFVLAKGADEAYEEIRNQRYEKVKLEEANIQFKPDRWDYGREAARMSDRRMINEQDPDDTDPAVGSVA